MPVLKALRLEDESGQSIAGKRTATGESAPSKVLMTSSGSIRTHTLKLLLVLSPEVFDCDVKKRLVCFQIANGVKSLHAAVLSWNGGLDFSDVCVADPSGSPYVVLDTTKLFKKNFRATNSREEQSQGKTVPRCCHLYVAIACHEHA